MKNREINFRKAGLRPLVCATAMFLLFSSSFAQNFSGGNGMQNNPYIITTAAELAQLATYVNAGDTNYNDKHYKLANNINLSAYGAGFNNGKGWIPIGKYDHVSGTYNCPFKGVFDGDSNVITGLYINDANLDHAGLFGYITKNSNTSGVSYLRVDSANITGGSFVGGITGRTYGGCHLLNCSSSGNIVGSMYVGGLAGHIDYDFIFNCYSSCDVSGQGMIGGVLGMAANECIIVNCYSTGDVSGGGMVGGIVGSLSLRSDMMNCYSTGNITGGNYVGGIAGLANGASIKNCYATGNIIGNKCVGGIVGEASGILGCSDGYIIDNVALNPSVNGDNYVGRIMGYNISGATINNNTAYDSMLNKAGNTTWNDKGATKIDGADISKETINTDGTLGGRFIVQVWTTQNGKLPGLFGKTVDMPLHLRMSGEVGVVGIDNSNIKIYPNPTKGQLTIESTELKIEMVEILDILGKCVYTTSLRGTKCRSNPENNNEYSGLLRYARNYEVVIDVSHLASGAYFVSVYSEGQKITRKFVKE